MDEQVLRSQIKVLQARLEGTEKSAEQWKERYERECAWARQLRNRVDGLIRYIRSMGHLSTCPASEKADSPCDCGMTDIVDPIQIRGCDPDPRR